jgi:hypothetical protein
MKQEIGKTGFIDLCMYGVEWQHRHRWMKRTCGRGLDTKRCVKQDKWNVRVKHVWKMKRPPGYSLVYPRVNHNNSPSLDSSLRWRTMTSWSSSSSSIVNGLANDPAGWSSGKFCMRYSQRWLISFISLWVCWQIRIGFGSGLWNKWEMEEGVRVSGGVWGDPIGRWKGVLRLELIIHWYRLSKKILIGVGWFELGLVVCPFLVVFHFVGYSEEDSRGKRFLWKRFGCYRQG